jgi:nucleoside 2-deoxyribosyltransferase
MNVYFSCSITGGRQDEEVYQTIAAGLLADAHQVPTAHLADTAVIELEAQVSPGEVFRRDITWLQGCDAMVAEVSTPSHGVGYEIAYALGLGKPVLCLARQGRRVSKMLSGNDTSGLQFETYSNGTEAVRLVREFIHNCEFKHE